MNILFFSVMFFFHLFYLISIIKKDFSIVDVAWGPSFLLIYSVGLIQYETWNNTRIVMVGILVTVWALRLSGYIFYRGRKIGQEDYRYAQWRSEWGEKANLIAYFKVFLLQGCLALIMASPLYLLHSYSQEAFVTKSSLFSWPSIFDISGFILAIAGFLFESIGDYQKHIFKSLPQNKGKICQIGLWKYSRHPNYFGEAMFWWGIFLIAINHIPFYYAMIGPLILNFFLLKVSGVALAEKKFQDDPIFSHYKKSTNSFIPWFPRRYQ